jgi:hypothetical protein
LLFDVAIVTPITRQVIALKYPSTDGTILSSKVSEREGNETTCYGVDVEYSYWVGKRHCTGDRYRYPAWSASDSDWARAVVAACPPDSKVQVFYDPADPQNSLLAPGIIGSDLYLLAFMTPFNAVMLGFWWIGWSRWRLRRLKPVAGGVRIIQEPGKMRVRLPSFSPLAVTLATTGVLAFISIFVVGIHAGGWHPAMRTMAVTWCMILGGGLLAGGWHLLRILSGKYDLVLDKLGSAIELPLTHGRKTRLRVPAAIVHNVRVETVTKSTYDGEGTSPMFAPTLEVSEPEPRSERLVEWYDDERAESFVRWLRDQLPQKSLMPPQQEKT